ncbi:MAG: Dps family protein [Bacteriovoracaceae bacterium]
MKSIHIGINESHRKEIVQGLDRLLADTYSLYLQTHNFHWNVSGPMFHTLLLLFESQYQEMAIAVDDIAERIRALGLNAPATFSEFLELTSIKEVKGTPAAMKMVEILLSGHESVIRTSREAIKAADEASDTPTVDLLTRRMHVHEKAGWMLRSIIA